MAKLTLPDASWHVAVALPRSRTSVPVEEDVLVIEH